MHVLYGVPQGLILGPLLFNYYIYDIFGNINNDLIRKSLYADDTKLALEINNIEDCHTLQLNLDKLIE